MAPQELGFNIDPKILSDSLGNIKAYNFGIDGHNFWMLQYLRRYMEFHVNIQEETNHYHFIG